MENIWLVVAWTLVMFLVSAASFIVIYRKLNLSTRARLSKLNEAEKELHDELMQIDIHEFGQTESGMQLLKLLSQETPQLLHRIISEQRKVNYNRMKEDQAFTSNAKASDFSLQEAARASAQLDLLMAIADELEKIKDTQYTEPLILSLSGILVNELADPELHDSLIQGKLEKLKKMIAVSESKKSAS